MLDAFLERMAALPFQDGRQDCALTVADWAIEATGCPDPAEHLRGRYSTALGRERLLKRMGGLEAVVTDCAERAGLFETDEPRCGDIGVIVSNGLQLSAIFLGQRWAVKSSEGLTVLPADRVLKAWEVRHG